MTKVKFVSYSEHLILVNVNVKEVDQPILPSPWSPAPSAGRRRQAGSLFLSPCPSPSDSAHSSSEPESTCPCLRSHTVKTNSVTSQEEAEQAHTQTHTSTHTVGGNIQSGTLNGAVCSGNLGIAAEEAVRDGDVDVEGQRLQDADLRGEQLLLLVGVVANVQEVVDTRRTALLQKKGR